MKKNYSNKKLNKSLTALIAVFCALFADSAMAQKNIGWTGATNNNWSTASNWNYPAVTLTATFATGSATVTLVNANTDIAVGDQINGYGIPQGTVINAIDTTKKILTISQNTQVAIVAPGENVVVTFATPKAATGAPTIVDIALINNGGNPTLTVGSYYLAGISIGNKTGAVTGSTLTIPSNVEIYVETLTNEGVLVKGGNIVNNGLLDVKSSLSTGTAITNSAYAMTFGLPEVVPSVATDYTYSGTGLLNLDTSASSTSFNSGGILFNGASAAANLATYKLLFNGTETFALSTTVNAANGSANTQLMKALGISTFYSCKVVIGGVGLNLGSETAGYINGILSTSGGGVDVTIAAGTTINLYSDKANPGNTFGMYVFGGTAIPSYIRNKGTVLIKGMTRANVIGLSSQTGGIVNFVNEGTFTIDIKSTVAGVAAIAVTNNGGTFPPSDVIVTNSGTMTLKSLLNGASWGAPILISTFATTANFHLINSGTLNLIGSNYSFGGRVYIADTNNPAFLTQTGASRITNSGTINTNQEIRTFYTVNTSTGKITFATTPENVLKLVTFTVPTIHAAAVGTTYTDARLNVHTVAVAKVSGTGTTLVTHVNGYAVNPSTTNTVDPLLPVTLTKTDAGVGDASITFTALTTNNDNAFFQPAINSGVINTNAGTRLMTGINGVLTQDATSVLSPGGDTGKSIALFGEAAADAYTLKGTIKMQVSGSTTAGVDYDLIRFPGQLDVINISQATLDVTGIYTPTADTTIDILTTNSVATFEGAIENGGPFASVVGLTPGWKVVYDILPGKVKLEYKTLGTDDVAFSNFKFNYYPNPTSNQLNLSSERNISKVELFNVLGQKVQSNTINAAQKQLNIGHLQKGIYFMEVSIDSAKKTFKIVKQ